MKPGSADSSWYEFSASSRPPSASTMRASPSLSGGPAGKLLAQPALGASRSHAASMRGQPRTSARRGTVCAFRRAARRQSDRGPRPGSDPDADEMNPGVQITGVFPAQPAALTASRNGPQVQGLAGSPASVPCPPRPGSRPVLVPAERDGHRCWLVGGRKPGPNRPTQPAWNWTLPGASRTVTFAER